MAEIVIRTAIPRRRYQLADFTVTVLGDVDAADGLDYKYLMAVVPEGESKPILYVAAQRLANGACRLKAVAPAHETVVDESPRWCELEAFSDEGLLIVRKILGVMNEEPFLM